jgi:hypothetical protein
MRVAYLTIVATLVAAGAAMARAATPAFPHAPVIAGLLGGPVFVPAFPALPATPKAPAEVPVTSGGSVRAAGDLPFDVGPAAVAEPSPGAPLGPRHHPPLAPISPAELRGLVAPAVVALVAGGGTKTPPQVATGVLVTASGLILTSRRAISQAIDSRAAVTMIHGGPRGRLGAHEIAEAVPARIVGVSRDLDLALVEALPPASVFYPHLPVTRRPVPAGANALAVGHSPALGFWAASAATIAAPSSLTDGGRWLRDSTAMPPTVGLGTPLVDGVGRIVALITEPEVGALRAVDAEALLRFLLALRAPALRFAGVPPYRRAAPGTNASLSTAGAPAWKPGHLDARVPVDVTDSAMPKVTDKGSLDRRVRDATAAQPEPPRLAPPGPPGPGHVSFDGEAGLAVITVAELASHPWSDTVTLDAEDAPDRGPRDAPVTAIELGDYHAPQTREAELAVRALTEGADARLRLFWRDADRGDGPAYLLAARAARAAREQDEFWPVHDRLMKGPQAPSAADLRRIARAAGLDMKEFDAAFGGEGLQLALESEGDRAVGVPVLATPSFVVNGRPVDGGAVAGAALRAAVDEELAAAEARRARQPIAAAIARQCRPIAAGGPVAGTKLDAAATARSIASAAARNAERARRLTGTTATP